jgi:DNA-binding XRE family transcriptional regulator
MQKEQRNQNRLDHYRRRMRFTTSQIGHLLGHQDSSTFCEFERGDRLPSLVNAFCLGIILRVPVEFLFPELYNRLRNDIRAEEERMARPEQQPLF